MPKVSVVMAVGAWRPFVDDALQSLHEQTFRDFEILTQSEPGLAAARNIGIHRARGEYIAIQDADDLSYPTRLERQVEYLDRYPDVSVVGTWGDRMGDRNGTCKPPENVTLRKLFMWDRVIHTSAMMRKDDVLPFGPYRPVMFEDWDLWIRLVKAGKKVMNIPMPLVGFRFSNDNHSSRIPRAVWYAEQVRQRTRCYANW